MDALKAREIDPHYYFQTDPVQEVRIFLSEEEVIASRLMMASPQEWASSELHGRLGNIITQLCNQYVSNALENGWEVPSSKLGILRKALEHYSGLENHLNARPHK